MSDFRGLYDIRGYQESDKSFIMATFLKGLYYGDSWFSMIPKPIFMQNYKRVAEALLNSPNVFVEVACLKEDPTVILGYCILSTNFETVHWVFVKAAWRKRGIAKSMVPLRPTAVSHLSKLGKQLLEEKLKTAIFNPFAL